MAMGDREGGGGGEGEGGGGGEGEKTVKVGQKISLKVNLKSFAPKVCTKSQVVGCQAILCCILDSIGRTIYTY